MNHSQVKIVLFNRFIFMNENFMDIIWIHLNFTTYDLIMILWNLKSQISYP